MQIVGSSIPYQGSLDDVPSSKYSALFDERDCFDGLRISFLGQLCGRSWENVGDLLPSDIDDVRYAQLIAFCAEYALPLKEASLPVSEPGQFLAESWKVLRLAACDTQQAFYLSYDELLLACALRRENVVIFGRHGGDMILLGSALSDRSKPVTLVSPGLAGTCSRGVL